MADLSTEPVDNSPEDTEADDVSLEDMEVSFDDQVDEDETETESDGTDDQAQVDDDEDDEEAESDQQDEEEPDEAEASDETEEAEPELTREQQDAAFKQEMYQRRQQEKAAREAGIREQQQAYLAEAQDDQDLALRQLQIDAYDNKVTRNTDVLQTSYERAIKDFEILRTNDPVIQAEIDATIDAFQAQFVAVDGYGNPVDIRGDLYQTLQAKADSIAKLTGIGARKQVQSKTKERTKVTTVPSRSPKTPKVDPDVADFDEEASKW